MAEGGFFDLAKTLLLNLPMGAGLNAPAPRWTIASALEPYYKQKRREEGLTQLHTMGLLPEGTDPAQLAKMDEGLMGTALRLLEHRGQQAKLGEIPGAVQAFAPGIKEPTPTTEYGLLPPEMGEGPTRYMTSGLSPEEEQTYQQVADLLMPRQDITRLVGEHRAGQALADQIRAQFPEYRELVPASVDRTQASLLRQDFMNRRTTEQKAAKEQQTADALARQFNLPPGLPLAVTQEAMREQVRERGETAREERFNRSQAAIAGRFAQSMGEWDRRFAETERAKESGENRRAVISREAQLFSDIARELISAKDRLVRYREQQNLLPTPENTAAVQEAELEVRQLEQRKTRLLKSRMQSGQPSGPGAAPDTGQVDLFELYGAPPP